MRRHALTVVSAEVEAGRMHGRYDVLGQHERRANDAATAYVLTVYRVQCSVFEAAARRAGQAAKKSVIRG
jgi:hypothetical protein